MHRVNFLDFHNRDTVEIGHLVYIHPSSNSEIKNFFHMNVNSPFHGTLACCNHVPEGYLTRCMSIYVHSGRDRRVILYIWSTRYAKYQGHL